MYLTPQPQHPELSQYAHNAHDPHDPHDSHDPLSPGLQQARSSTPAVTCTPSGAGGHKNICGRCNQKKWPVMRRSSRGRGDRRSHLGEVTVLAVGRFRVTKCDPKTAKERKTLIITEKNGRDPVSHGDGTEEQNNLRAAGRK
ncbi:hypothetical protein ANANG_G00140050 [Anguilla anguilla]|uniref:Uncharacterized protein n=1 Tax=Anguilla anguilla TaxID=7936 RepID=A0A9D3MDJ5_ANGAN|nr:hypothetical protein ANANG_G00140050 [Anguilla anguilla]